MEKENRGVALLVAGKRSVGLAGWLGLMVCLAGSLSSCRKEMSYYQARGRLHTPYQIKYQHTRPLDADIDKQLKYFYYLFNAFDSTSLISRINRNETMEVDTLFAKVFREALKVSNQTGGAYDITSAPLINL